MNVRSQAKRLKYHKYDIPEHLFFPISVGRTNVLSADAHAFCEFVAKSFPTITNACDSLRASIGRAITIGAARTLSVALRQAQLAAFNARAASTLPRVFPLPSFPLPRVKQSTTSIGASLRPISTSTRSVSCFSTQPAAGCARKGFEPEDSNVSLAFPLRLGSVGRLES